MSAKKTKGFEPACEVNEVGILPICNHRSTFIDWLKKKKKKKKKRRNFEFI